MGPTSQIPSAMETCFPSPRHDAFPAGLRVLVVDDDPTWLKILEKMLKKCTYEVTTCGLARDALNLLRERKDGYDIVISDVNMPDMDGFKLLEHVGLEMDLPVIMMSVDGETSRVMKGVQHGACDYLLKPIRMKELRNIWQHVVRKKIHEGKDIDSLEVIDGLQMNRSGLCPSDDHFFGGEDISSGKKRKEVETKHDDRDCADPGTSTKKARVVWSVDLHQKFVKAVNQIGFEKVGPKRILDLMNVPRLTRENVASHLQKYRLYLSRLQKENDLKTCFGGTKHSDTASKDPSVSFSTQNIMPQEDVPDRNFGVSSNKLLAQNANSKSRDIEPKGVVATPREEPKSNLIVEVPNQRESRGMETGLKQSFVPFDPEERYTALSSNIPAHYSWRGVPEISFKEESDPRIHLEDSGCSLKSTNSRLHLAESEGTNSVEYKPLYADHQPNNVFQASPSRMQSDTIVVQGKDNTVHCQDFHPICSGPPNNIQGQGFDLSGSPALQPAHKNLLSISKSSFGPSDEDFQGGWLQEDPFSANLRLQNSGFIGYSDPCFVAEVPITLYDALRFDYEQFVDPNECSIADHGLFMV